MEFILQRVHFMSDKIITVNIPLSEDKFKSLIDFAVYNNISAEQLSSQIVQQWVNTLPSTNKYVSRKTD